MRIGSVGREEVEKNHDSREECPNKNDTWTHWKQFGCDGDDDYHLIERLALSGTLSVVSFHWVSYDFGMSDTHRVRRERHFQCLATSERKKFHYLEERKKFH